MNNIYGQWIDAEELTQKIVSSVSEDVTGRGCFGSSLKLIHGDGSESELSSDELFSRVLEILEEVDE